MTKANLNDYEVREGKDGKTGIYLRHYNVRLAVFNANSHCLITALQEVFDEGMPGIGMAPKRKANIR